MFLYELFPPELVKVGLEADDKDEAFEEMVDKFCQVSKLQVREPVLKALHIREAKMSTGIVKGIAIPHANTDAIEHMCGILGISKKGIDYDAPDGNLVYLIFMILVPPRDVERHLRILRRLANLLDNESFYQDLLSQKESQAAVGVIRKYEDSLILMD
ncbi:PTS sugar transporter subunit IIA [Breznakiellaceae bacterium SP9]